MKRNDALRIAPLVLAGAIGCSGTIGGGAGSADGGTGEDGAVSMSDAGPTDLGTTTTSTACEMRVARPPPDGTWKPAGPSGGNVTAVLAAGGGVILAGTGQSVALGGHPGRAAAIYLSIDRGATFRRSIAF